MRPPIFLSAVGLVFILLVFLTYLALYVQRLRFRGKRRIGGMRIGVVHSSLHQLRRLARLFWFAVCVHPPTPHAGVASPPRRVDASASNRTGERPAPEAPARFIAASAATRWPSMVVGPSDATGRRPTSTTRSGSRVPRSAVELAQRRPALSTVVCCLGRRRCSILGRATWHPRLWSERGAAFDRTSRWWRARWTAHGAVRAGSGRLDAAALHDASSATALPQALSLPHGRATAADAAQPVASTIVGCPCQYSSQGRGNRSCDGSIAGPRPSAPRRGARPSPGWSPATWRCGPAGGGTRCCAGDAAGQGA